MHATHVHEARRAHVDLVRHAFAGADEVEAELAVGRLVRSVDVPRRHLRSVHNQLEVVDQRFDLGVDEALLGERAAAVVDVDRPLREHVHQLPDHVYRLVHFAHPDVVAVVVVAVDPDRHVEVEFGVGEVRRVLAQVERRAGGAQDRAGVAPVDRLRRRDHADVAHAVDEDAVAVHQPVHAPDELLVLVEDPGEALEPAVRQVARESADPSVRVRDACAGQVGDVLVHVVADHDQVQERGHRAQLHQPRGDAGQMVDDPRVLGQQRAQVAAARRDPDVHQRLDRLAVREVVDQRRHVVEPVDVGNQVVPGVRLALLLEAAVQVAAVHVGAQHALAVELRDDLDRPVRRRVRRPDVDDDRVVTQRRLEGRADRIGQRGFHGSRRHFRYGTSGCSWSLRVVLAQRMADEALVEQDRAQVGVAAEDDAVHVVALPLHEARGAVQRDQRIDDRVLLRDARLQAHAYVMLRRVEVPDDLEALRAGPASRPRSRRGRGRTGTPILRRPHDVGQRGGRQRRPRACRASRATSRAMGREPLLQEVERRGRHDQKSPREDRVLRAGDLVLQLHDPVDHHFGPRGTAGDVDVDRDDPVDAQHRRVVLVEAAARRADAEGHHPLRLAHLLVDLEQHRRLLVRDRADDHQQVGLPRREPRQRGAEAVGVVGAGADRHELHRAAGGDERVREQRELARPADQLVLLGRQVFERLRLRGRPAWIGIVGVGHGYSVTASRSRAL